MQHTIYHRETSRVSISYSVKQLNVIASFPAHSSLAVQNLRRRPGPFYHVMRAAAFTSHVQRNLSVTCNDIRGYQGRGDRTPRKDRSRPRTGSSLRLLLRAPLQRIDSFSLEPPAIIAAVNLLRVSR